MMAQAIHPDSFAPIGEAVSIAEQVSISGFSASSTGVLVYGTGQSVIPNLAPGIVRGQLTWLDREGRILSTVGDPGVYRTVALSPDDTRAAVESLGEQAKMEISILEFARGSNTKFTFHPEAEDFDPVWSAKGDRLVFASAKAAGIQWYQKASNMVGSEEPVFTPPEADMPHSWHGNFILYNGIHIPTDIWAVDVSVPAADRKPIPVVTSKGNDVNARFSPDGKLF
jgi:hypothetical protein